MKLRVGASPIPHTAFLRNTLATPVVSGQFGPSHYHDWPIMKLKTCVGSRPDTGWFEVSDLEPSQMNGLQIAAAGYAGDRLRGELSFSTVLSGEIEPANKLVKHSASVAGDNRVEQFSPEKTVLLNLLECSRLRLLIPKLPQNLFGSFD